MPARVSLFEFPDKYCQKFFTQLTCIYLFYMNVIKYKKSLLRICISSPGIP